LFRGSGTIQQLAPWLLRVGITILTYHSLDESGSVISVAPRLFNAQMQLLSDRKVRVIPLDQATDMLEESLPPENCVVITFDDGFRNIYECGFPILQRYGFTATIFLLPRYCGRENSWAPSFLRRPLLSWGEIAEMHKHGFDFGAHTLTHPDLTQVAEKDAEAEIRQSQEEIQDRLGAPVKMFAYPYGRCNLQVKTIVRQYFAGACSTSLGRNYLGADPYWLKRVDMYYLANPALFKALSSKILDGYLGIRQLFRDIKESLGSRYSA
jgi:peptidoglycan/xylan/chitin deacetylase (PgdA/CDA1 family)